MTSHTDLTDLTELTGLAELAAARVGGKAIAANDEFFAAKENLLKAGRGVFIPGKYTSRGKWMDGWESRRRRTPGHDWCVVRLGMPGAIRGVDVDTNHFIGNFPERCSLDACYRPGTISAAPLLGPRTEWVPLLPESRLVGGSPNLFRIASDRVWTHVRLNIHPDGGVARLRVYGQVEVDAAALARSKRLVDLASIKNGGLVLGASDMHFGSKDNLIMPGRSANMGDGWETRRRRGPGHDWLVLRLGAPGVFARIEIDTNHFKGNYPESASLEGCVAEASSLETLASDAPGWQEVLPRTKLGPHKRHFFARELVARGPFTHVRFRIFPDGGVSRLRIHGRVVTPE
ncbi:MAG: allantoicase [Solirubrobacterales bacterium]|jgi:allantoicase